ncbi:hypothetical protein Ple7327_2128 [Pleurocapsa sp. PCC 7327]|nr:hypothetical protein Ple7327_2128 [Pleurocapsa sp. PCC 7327]
MKTRKISRNLVYIILLFLFSMTACETFSLVEMNIFIKAYGLLLALQAGFALIYLNFYRLRHR